MDAAQEQAWVGRAQAGDKDAFEALVLHYRPHVVRFAQSLVHDEFFAEDIAQDCFAKVYWRLDGFKAGTSFKSWLFAIVRNRCIDHLRARRPMAEWNEALEAPGGEGPEEALARKEEWAEFLAVWRQLPGDARTALYLFAAEGMCYEEAARVMEKSVPQVKMMMYRARKKLRAECEKEAAT